MELQEVDDHINLRTERVKQRFAEIYNKADELFNWDGDIVEIKLLDESVLIGILQSNVNLEGNNSNITFEPRGLNEKHEKGFCDIDKWIKLHVVNILSIRKIKDGDDRFTRQEVIDNLRRLKITEEQIAQCIEEDEAMGYFDK